MSRFVSNKKNNQILSKLNEGKIDIVIGTHKLLNEKIKFDKLGLLIIDEEHKFGVEQKEKIKKKRNRRRYIKFECNSNSKNSKLSLKWSERS